ncbi:TIGR03067 domain-containing protein [Candidatus Protochlamydia phocaeensis]|uniref:TIGR03067 domain-containing protein n=1 Tax=Candidatus Protochlamydia phocaeensis TaxID=1414722 RepID=UPI0008384CE8|nr:TIGR03067 domain-containing protein [Candidatus Protochlamydia phocaeensis]
MRGINKIASFAIFLSFCSLSCFAQSKDPALSPGIIEQGDGMNKKSTARLEGKWRVIGCQLNTVWLPSPIFENFIYSFPDKEHYKLDWADLTFPKYVGGFPKSPTGRISINTNVTPNEMDLVPDTGPYAGQTLKGIFELDHDILKANFSFPDHARPKEFAAEQNQVYEIWQRL